MVYLPTGSSDLILIPGCMTSNLLVLELFLFVLWLFWRTDTIIFSKLNKPRPGGGGGGGLIEDLWYSSFTYFFLFFYFTADILSVVSFVIQRRE